MLDLLTLARRHCVRGCVDSESVNCHDCEVMGETAYQRIKQQGLLQPDAPAVVFRDQTTTFGELCSQAEADGRAFLRAGVSVGDRVGLAVARSTDLIALVLASLGTGMAYVPLDPRLPGERLTYMAEDAGVSLAILPTDERPHWLPHTVRSLSLDALRAMAPKSDASFTKEFTPPSPTDLAYVIYTSGSTGRPKGVRISQANLSCILDAWSSVAHTTPSSTFLFHSTLSFDASLTEFLWPLSMGLRVVIVPDEARTGFGDSFGALISRYNVTHVQCTPTRAVLLLSDPVSRRSLRGVQQVLVGGEALPPALVHQFSAAGVQTITNIYGPTECSIWSFSYDVGSTVGASVPIGRPLPGVTAFVMDETLQSVPDDVEGELVVAGPFVGAGYHNRQELSAEKFSVLMENGTTLPIFRTGDRVVRRADGVHEFRGRIDTQVKLRGQRIELGEIESVLSEHPVIDQAVAAVVGHGIGDDRLVAYVRVSPGATFDEIAVQSMLAGRLPSTMMPSSFVVVEDFPLTPSGKVDRRALPDPPPKLVNSAPGTELEGTPLDTIIADFAAVFGRNVGPDDDFFALGGHSLLAVALLARIGERTRVELPLTVLLDAPTPRLLAERAANPGGLSATSSLVRFGPSVRATRLYLVHGGGGNVLGFREIARKLVDVVEVVGVQAVGVEPGQVPDQSMDQMVDRYATALCTDDPDGPYWIGGYSDGGLIALHLAQELRSRGGEIAGLVLLDAFVAEPMPPTTLGRFANVVRNGRDRGGRSVGTWVRTSWRAWRARTGYLDANAEAASKLGYVGVDTEVDRAVVTASDPGLIPAPALLFRSTEATPTHWFDYSLVLRAPATTRTVWVPGGHSTVFSGPNVATVAGEIQRFLDGDDPGSAGTQREAGG